MSIYTGIGGVVKEPNAFYAGVGGVVKPLTSLESGVNGVVKNIWSASKLNQIDSVQLCFDYFSYSINGSFTGNFGTSSSHLNGYGSINSREESGKLTVTLASFIMGSQSDGACMVSAFGTLYGVLKNGEKIRLVDYDELCSSGGVNIPFWVSNSPRSNGMGTSEVTIVSSYPKSKSYTDAEANGTIMGLSNNYLGITYYGTFNLMSKQKDGGFNGGVPKLQLNKEIIVNNKPYPLSVSIK